MTLEDKTLWNSLEQFLEFFSIWRRNKKILLLPTKTFSYFKIELNWMFRKWELHESCKLVLFSRTKRNQMSCNDIRLHLKRLNRCLIILPNSLGSQEVHELRFFN